MIINGNSVGHDPTGDADLEETIEGIVGVINSDGTVGAIVEASAVESEPGVSGIDTVLIKGLGEADYSVDFTQDPGGGATPAVVADRCRATGRLWWKAGARAGSTPPTTWADQGDEIEVGYRGFVQRFDSAGFDRLHVQLYELAGDPGDGSIVTYRDPVVSIGPCLSEVS